MTNLKRFKSTAFAGMACFTALMAASSATAAPVVIGFEGLPQGTFAPITTYSEQGFTINKTSGNLHEYIGSPGNAIAGGTEAGGTDGSFDLTDGGLFSFNSFDSASGAGNSYSGTVTGFLNSVSLYSQTFFGGGPYKTNIASSNTLLFDKLNFSLRASAAIDNISVTPAAVVVPPVPIIPPVGIVAAVPEPATWAMMIVGFGLVGGALRRRKTANTTQVSYAV